MRKVRAIVIPAILALSAAGTILAGSSAPAVAQASSTHVLVVSAKSSTHYWG